MNPVLEKIFPPYFAARGWILAALFAALVWSRFHASIGEAPLRWEMLAVVAAGMLLRAWAGAHLGPHGNGPRAEAPALASSGPYAFSRNPLYLSNIAVGAGLLFFANSLSQKAAAVFLAFLALHHIALALWEERYLRLSWPAEYEAYAASTPRWFSLRPPEKAENITETKNWSPVPRRQGRNLGYILVCILVLWAAARWTRG